MLRLLSPLAKTATTILVVAAAGLAAPSHALNISQVPLHLGGGVKPNFIMAIDDSVSMGEERTFPGGNMPYGRSEQRAFTRRFARFLVCSSV